MQNKFLVLSIILFVAVSVSGCATLYNEKARAIRDTPKGKHTFDLSKGAECGRLVIHAFPSSKQMFIKNYAFQIDGSEPEEIFKHSDTEITLNAGSHELKIYVPAPESMKWMYGKTFGKITTKQIAIEKDQVLTLEYTGPYWVSSEGKLEEKASEE